MEQHGVFDVSPNKWSQGAHMSFLAVEAVEVVEVVEVLEVVEVVEDSTPLVPTPIRSGGDPDLKGVSGTTLPL